MIKWQGPCKFHLIWRMFRSLLGPDSKVTFLAPNTENLNHAVGMVVQHKLRATFYKLLQNFARQNVNTCTHEILSFDTCDVVDAKQHCAASDFLVSECLGRAAANGHLTLQSYASCIIVWEPLNIRLQHMWLCRSRV